MEINTVMAQLIVTDLGQSVDFYSALFERPPDATPMDGLCEWHFGGGGAVQVYQEPERAGSSGVTLNMSDLDVAVGALDRAGIDHDPILDADYVRIVQLNDPDNNRIVLTGTK